MSDGTNDLTRIAKDFHWEMGHRLPFHKGLCENIHGHSYRMLVVIDGRLDGNGMVMDYFDMKEIVDPIVQRLDHAFLCDDRDEKMLEFFGTNPLKHVIVPFRTTAENLAGWFLDEISALLKPYDNIVSLTVRVHETERTFAERSMRLDA